MLFPTEFRGLLCSNHGLGLSFLYHTWANSWFGKHDTFYFQVSEFDANSFPLLHN